MTYGSVYSGSASRTVTLTANSTTVQFSGTLLTESELRAEDTFQHAGLQLAIASITDDDTLELALPWPGSNVTASTAWRIVRDAPSRLDQVEAASAMTQAYGFASLINAQTRALAVESESNTPPGSPVTGRYYLAGASPSGWAISVTAGDIVKKTGSGWATITPETGWLVVIKASGEVKRFIAGAWGTFGGVSDPELLAIAGLTSAANKGIYFTGAGSAGTYDLTSLARDLLAGASTTAMLTTLGLTANGQSLVTAANYAAMRTLLGLVIGTHVQAADAELSALAALTSAANKVPRFTGSGTADLLDFSTDGTLAGNSDTTLASQKAVKTYVDQIVAAQDAMVFRGVIDASTNPNYPAADRGHTWRISVAGKIGGASGPNVEAGDIIICLTDGTAAGTAAAVGANWGIIQANIDGAVIGPASSNDGRFAAFSGTSGKLLQELTGAQATALLDTFTSSLKGLVPASGGGTTNFLRADGTWAVPPGGGGSSTPYRNRIVNGAMIVSQERGIATVDVTTGTQYTVDQWYIAMSASPGGTIRAQQVATATPGGSPSRLRLTVQAADTSIGASERYFLEQDLEGQMIADARFGSASARQIILRLGVRSSIAATFCVALRNGGGTRSWLGTFSVASGEVNTDLVRTLLIPGDTTGTWATDNTRGMLLTIGLAGGTDFQGVAGWQNGNFLSTSAQTNFMGTASATFDLFDVGFYVDALATSTAPTWEMPAFDEELRRCQRYWSTTFASARFNASAATQNVEMPIYWPVVMRTTPTLAITSGGSRLNLAATYPQTAGATVNGARFFIQSNASGDTYALNDIITASARL